MIKIYNYGEVENSEIFARQNTEENVSRAVSEIIAEVVKNGDNGGAGGIAGAVLYSDGKETIIDGCVSYASVSAANKYDAGGIVGATEFGELRLGIRGDFAGGRYSRERLLREYQQENFRRSYRSRERRHG